MKACDGGNANGCYRVAERYFSSVGLQDISRNEEFYSKGINYFTKACDKGSSDACLALGFINYDGTAVKQNVNNAVEFFTKSCNMGNAKGCLKLGILYNRGQGMEQDNSISKIWYKKACDLREERGCKEL